MIAALLRKEWREHRWVVLPLWVVCFMGVSTLLVDANDDGSPLIALQKLVAYFGSLLALILVSRIVVREYRGRTQFFLEALPVTRTQIVTVKFMTGLFFLLVPMVLCSARAVFAARDVVTLNASLLQWIAIRGGSYLLFIYALAFAIALTGRYRFAMWALLAVIVSVLNKYTQLPFDHLPPFHLITSSIAFEHNSVALSELLVTWSGIAALIIAAFALALTAEGALIGSLYGRMSQREKVLFTVVALCVIMVTTELDKRTPKPPFRLQASVSSGATNPLVSIALDSAASNDIARHLPMVKSMDQRLRDLQSYLQLSTLPAVFILPDASLDADVFLRANLSDADGVVLRAAISSPQFNADDFTAFALTQVLEWYSRGRNSHEAKRWLRDGFVQWWMARSDAQQRRLTLRAAVANQLRPFDSNALRAWLTTREQLGDCLSDATAWRVVSMLSQQMDAESFQALLRSMLGVRPTDDVRAALFDPNLEEQLQREHGPTLNALTVQVAQGMLAENARLQSQLTNIKLWPVNFSAVRMRGDAYEIHYSLDTGNLAALPFAVRYLQLSPWQAELQRAELARVDAIDAGVLPLTVQRGAQLFTAAEMYSEPLVCTLRFGARRWVIP